MVVFMEKLIEYLLSVLHVSNFYVLGSGVSSPIVPMTQQMPGIIINKFNQIGVYPVAIPPNRDLTKKLLGEAYKTNWITERISGYFTIYTMAHELTRPHHNLFRYPYQYLIFDYLMAPQSFLIWILMEWQSDIVDISI
jgi:hypothetical protein